MKHQDDGYSSFWWFVVLIIVVAATGIIIWPLVADVIAKLAPLMSTLH